MRVLICNLDCSLGGAIGDQLTSYGHSVVGVSMFSASSWRKSGIRVISKSIEVVELRRVADGVDAVIDPDLPAKTLGKPMVIGRARPVVLKRWLEGSDRTLIATSSALSLGDTSPIPADETRDVNPPIEFSWLTTFERTIQRARGMRGIIIRPGWLQHGRGGAMHIPAAFIAIALKKRRGVYIGKGENRYSAVHCDDLAVLYCLALNQGKRGSLFHGSSENVSAREIATTINQGLNRQGEPLTISIAQAKSLTPLATALTKSHALSGNLAMETLGWQPTRLSVLNEIERMAYMSIPELARSRVD